MENLVALVLNKGLLLAIVVSLVLMFVINTALPFIKRKDVTSDNNLVLTSVVIISQAFLVTSIAFVLGESREHAVSIVVFAWLAFGASLLAAVSNAHAFATADFAYSDDSFKDFKRDYAYLSAFSFMLLGIMIAIIV